LEAEAADDSTRCEQNPTVLTYLHRKEGVAWNVDYWYSRAGRKFRRPTLDAEWEALVEVLLGGKSSGS
jgi:hypothetical protein